MSEPANAQPAAGRSCPSCAAPMQRRALAGKLMGALDLDLCLDCQAIWFDQFESAQLTPGSVLEVFRIIHEQAGHPARALSDMMRCVACRARLQLTHDIERSNHIVYYRCPEGHGRFTTFMQFLREKDFVRTLTLPEMERLRASAAQVRCSSCGAPIDIARDAECPYCHAPISILDADAVSRALQELSEQEQRRARADPAAAVEALLAGDRYGRGMAPRGAGGTGSLAPVDLVREALGLLFGTNLE